LVSLKNKYNKNKYILILIIFGMAVAYGQVHPKCFTEDVLNRRFVFGGRCTGRDLDFTDFYIN
jgi:hypothetical protein